MYRFFLKKQKYNGSVQLATQQTIYTVQNSSHCLGKIIINITTLGAISPYSKVQHVWWCIMLHINNLWKQFLSVYATHWLLLLLLVLYCSTVWINVLSLIIAVMLFYLLNCCCYCCSNVQSNCTISWHRAIHWMGSGLWTVPNEKLQYTSTLPKWQTVQQTMTMIKWDLKHGPSQYREVLRVENPSSHDKTPLNLVETKLQWPYQRWPTRAGNTINWYAKWTAVFIQIQLQKKGGIQRNHGTWFQHFCKDFSIFWQNYSFTPISN